MNIESKLADNGIRVNNTTVGNSKTKCPQCQPPHDSHDNPLSVNITDIGTAVGFVITAILKVVLVAIILLRIIMLVNQCM